MRLKSRGPQRRRSALPPPVRRHSFSLLGFAGLSPSCQMVCGNEQLRTVIHLFGELIMQYFAIRGGTASPIEKKNVKPRMPKRNARSGVRSFAPGIQNKCWLNASVHTYVIKAAFFGKEVLPSMYCRSV